MIWFHVILLAVLVPAAAEAAWNIGTARRPDALYPRWSVWLLLLAFYLIVIADVVRSLLEVA